MKVSKSEPKIKFSIKKYENFFTEKNLSDPIYLDTDQEPNT